MEKVSLSSDFKRSKQNMSEINSINQKCDFLLFYVYATACVPAWCVAHIYNVSREICTCYNVTGFGRLILYPSWYFLDSHCSDVIMVVMASQITSLTIVYSTVYSGADQRKHQSSASLALVRGIHRSGGLPAQMASNAKNVSIRWCHHASGFFPFVLIHGKNPEEYRQTGIVCASKSMLVP